MAIIPRVPGWNPFIEALGLDVPEPADGRCTAQLTVGPHHFNPFNMVHGAAIFAMADCTMGEALTTMLADDDFASTLESTINYVRPVTEGLLRCESTVLHRGRSTAVLESVVTCNGRLVAKAQGTYAIQRQSR